MKQYIDKSAVVAEIVRRIKHDEMVMDHNTQITELLSRELRTLYELLSFIKSLEVKEVDLEFLQHPSKVNNKLFKEIYFGKPYKTRDGRKALYCYKFTDNSHALIIEGDEEFWYVRDDGLVDDFDDSFMDSSYYTDKDIVSEW